MLSRDEILSAIDAIYAARAQGDKESLTTLWTADATFQLVGEASILQSMPVAPQSVQPSIGQMIDTFTFHSVERVDAIVEGNRAAVLIRVVASVAGGEPHETMLYDLWELNDDGQAKSLVEFSDTALVARMLTSIGAA
ncbi:MAG: nuclear transport factor 2 family protein [Sphingomonas sp.]|nr:nuclear transport factor 2 family protein [Sphingomonas sp.]